MRAVFDTNVLVAAFAANGLCAKILRRANKREFTLIVCPIILEELKRALEKKLGTTVEEIESAIVLLNEISTLAGKTAPNLKLPHLVRDPDDDLILACAVAAEADVLVTGDKDLLAIGEHGRTKILGPRSFELLFA